MKLGSQTTTILLDAKTEDVALREELLRIFAKRGLLDTRLKYPRLLELRQLLDEAIRERREEEK